MKPSPDAKVIDPTAKVEVNYIGLSIVLDIAERLMAAGFVNEVDESAIVEVRKDRQRVKNSLPNLKEENERED